MKKIGFFALILLILGGCKNRQAIAPPKYRIGLVTSTVSQSEDEFRGAEELLRRYGRAAEGGLIRHVTYPDNFMDQQETVITQITALADDPLVKAVIVNQGIPGTAEAFSRIRERRPEALLLVGEPQEDPPVIQKAATLAVSTDFISRGYTIPWGAKQMGADTFVHISFPRHMSYETMGTRRRIFESACADLGLRFVSVTAPDPMSDVGIPGAQQYILEQTPHWVEVYGQKAAFFCTNDAHTEPLLKQLTVYGGMFVEADLPSPLLGYAGALGIDLSAEAGNFPAILKKVETAVVERFGAGRFGAWAYSYSFAVTVGLAEAALRVLDAPADQTLAEAFQQSFQGIVGAAVKSGWYTAPETSVSASNHLLIFMDTYVFGTGALPTTTQEIPEKYRVLPK